MEVMQNLGTSNSLQTHMTSSGAVQSSSSTDNQIAESQLLQDVNSAAITTTTTTTNNASHIDDLTDNFLSELQTMPHHDISNTDTSLTDHLLNFSDTNNASASTLDAGSALSVKPDVDAVTAEDLLDFSSTHGYIQDSSAFKSTLDLKEEAVEEEPPAPEESPEVNVAINNVVCTFSTRCHLNLRQIALTGLNVEFKKAQGMLNMKIRNPKATASIWSSGKITVTGASSEDNCRIAARRIARKIQNLGFKVSHSPNMS